LRLLDSKNPAMQAVIEAAPQLFDYLGEESKTHFKMVTQILDNHGVGYRINPRLVRGMDYYNLTVFEFVTTQLGAQGTVCAGGRYDYLVEQIGGKPTPAVGWAMGVERVLELLKASGLTPLKPALDAFAIVTSQAAFKLVIPILQDLRRAGVSIQMQAESPEGMPSMKAQFKRADASGARYALIFGDDEMAQARVTIKPLRESHIPQESRAQSELAAWAANLRHSV
jgi:histidyl-tRNA synthetase